MQHPERFARLRLGRITKNGVVHARLQLHQSLEQVDRGRCLADVSRAHVDDLGLLCRFDDAEALANLRAAKARSWRCPHVARAEVLARRNDLADDGRDGLLKIVQVPGLAVSARLIDLEAGNHRHGRQHGVRHLVVVDDAGRANHHRVSAARKRIGPSMPEFEYRDRIGRGITVELRGRHARADAVPLARRRGVQDLGTVLREASGQRVPVLERRDDDPIEV